MTFCTIYTILTSALALYGVAHICHILIRSILSKYGRKQDVTETLLVGFSSTKGEIPALPADTHVKIRFVGKTDEERIEFMGCASPERIERDAKCHRIAALNPHHKWFTFEIHRFDLDKIPMQLVEIHSDRLGHKRHYAAVMDPERDHLIDLFGNRPDNRTPDGNLRAGTVPSQIDDEVDDTENGTDKGDKQGDDVH